MGNWVDDNKDSGPWNFTEQKDKWGYLNNPRWSNNPKKEGDPMSAADFSISKGLSLNPDDIHQPCGHWHKRRIVPTGDLPGNLYATGLNDVGQLGFADGTGAGGFAEYYNIETDIFTKVVCGWYHSLALKNDGTLWATGRNSNGQLGLGDTTNRYTFTQVGVATDWADIFCGDYNSFAIKTDGSLYACGYNGDYQLGLGDDVDKTTFTQVGSDTDWSMVGAGYYHTIFLKTTGAAYGVGYNGYGELGLGDETARTTLTLIAGTWKYVDCGQYFAMMIDSSDNLYAAGYNYYGQLGLGDRVDRNTFTQIGAATWDSVACGNEHTIALKSDGSIWSTGLNNLGQLGQGAVGSYVTSFGQIGVATDWTKVFAGVEGIIAINSSDELFGAGANGNAKLGNGNYNNITNTLVQSDGSWDSACIGYYHTIAIDSDGLIYVAGGNYYGVMGAGYNFIDTLTLVNDETWLAVDCWNAATLAIKDDTSVWGTGYCWYGEFGLGTNQGFERWEFTQLPVGTGWEQVACGGNHSILFKDGTIWGSGYNVYGQLGLGTNTTVYEFTQLAGTDWVFVAAGANCTMAINEDGELFSTGNNSGGNQGQLGLGDTTNRNTLTQCIGTGWKQVSIGGCHAAAVRNDGTLWTTGKNVSGELGLGDNTQRIIWTQVAGTDWDYVECGWDHTIAVTTSGDLYATGKNHVGQLGLNDLVNRNSFTFVSSGWKHDSFNGLAQFSGGSMHSLAINSSAILKATGDNYNGQLGLGDSGFEAVVGGGTAADNDRKEFTETAESVPEDSVQDTWEFVVCGEYHTMALKIVTATGTAYNDDDEPQIWTMPGE